MNTESMGTGMPGAKVPIYELAKELGIVNKDLVTKIRALGIDAKNHMSRLEPEDVVRVRRAIDKERQENTVQERLSDTVIRRRSKDGTMLHPQAPVPPPAPATPAVAPAPAVVTRPREPLATPAVSPTATPIAPVRSTSPTAATGRRIELPGRDRTEPREPAAEPTVRVRPRVEVKAEPTPPARVESAPSKPVEAKAPVAPAPVEAPAPAKAVEPAKVEAPVKAAEPTPAPPAAEAVKPAAPAEPEVKAPAPAQAAAQAPAQAQAQSQAPTPAQAQAPAAPAVAPKAPAAEAATPAPVAPEPVAARPAQAEPARPAPASAPAPAVDPPLPVGPRQTVIPAPQSRVFVTAQTRRANEGLGPTGRVIDLAALRPAQQNTAPKPSSESPRAGMRPGMPGVGEGGGGDIRGPRQEITGERLRQTQRQQQQRQQQKLKAQPGRKPKQTQITTAAEHKRVVKMDELIIIAELARQMGLKATDVLKKIWELGMRSVMINSSIDFDTAQLVATEFDWRVESTAFQEASVVSETTDQPEDLLPRAPVITIMGHVDHGKTSLLDSIRNANVAAGEAGGITQHIGAYKVASPSGAVVFLDTPGHEAFTEMRARGAQVTDIVVLVVAADDGVMPQTIEALNHAKDAEVPIIVAVNKVDKPGAQPDRIRQQLAAHNLTPEEWGGQTIYVDVSARTRVGIDRLLEMLALQSEVLELKANPNKQAKGAVVEARMDAKRGPVATVLIQEGTLAIGDTVVVGEEMGKVRAMMDDKGQQVQKAGPSTPVELLGLSGVPRAGEVLNAVSDERASKELVEFRRNKRIEKDRAKAGPVSLDKLMDAMKAGLKELKIILKADVQGSAEALSSALTKLSTPQVKVTVIQSGVGGITESDVNLAKAGNAIIIGFHVRPAGKAQALAEQEGVDIKMYDIIYDALDEVKQAMAGLLAPVKRDKALGKAEIRELFTIPKIGAVAGCFVTEGLMRRSAQARLVRDSVLIYTGKLGSLRRFKDDVREVQQGYECGLTIEGYLDIKVGDVVESFEVEEVAATLD